MSLIGSFGQRQQALLQLLLEHKDGLTMDELARAVEVSKAAVHQHLVALERGGYVSQRELRKTGGRPCQVYALTERGIHLFPKQYAWFAELLLKELITRLGRVEVQRLLYRLGQEVAASLRARLAGKAAEERLAEVVAMLVELGYEARVEGQTISAKNCVYHELASQYPEVCALDLGLLEALLGEGVTQTECMVRGGKACKFCVLKQTDSLGK